MVKGQRKRDEEAGIQEGVAGKRQQKDGEFMVGTHPLFMSRPRGESKSLGERSGRGDRWPRWLHLHLVWMERSQTGRMILSTSAEHLYDDA